MGIPAGAVPYNYGELTQITQDAMGRVYFWFTGADGVIRGVWMDTGDPTRAKIVPGENEIVVRRGGGTDSPTRVINMKASGAALPPIKPI